MSEYQFYEFKSIDKALTKEEQNIISSWSSRTRVTSSGAIFTYNYGDFHQDEEKVVEQYFDAMFYISNWGSKRIIFKFPKELINIDQIQKYCTEPEISLKIKKNSILLDLDFSEEEPDDDWIEGEGYLSSIISLRDDIINGDYRCLYLAWLNTNINGNENELEPSVPLGLNSLNSALQSFIDLLNINQDLLSSAIKNSKSQVSEKTPELSELINKLPEEEKSSFLIRLAKGESLLSQKLLKRLKDFTQNTQTENNSEKLRTISELRNQTEQNRILREKEEKQVQEELRLKKLDQLEKNETKLWQEVDIFISEKKSKSYDNAIDILKDLKELAKHKNQIREFNIKVNGLLEKYSKFSSFKTKLNNAGLK